MGPLHRSGERDLKQLLVVLLSMHLLALPCNLAQCPSVYGSHSYYKLSEESRRSYSVPKAPFFFFFLFHVIRLRHNRSQPSSVSVPTCEGGEQTVPGHFLKINLYFQEVRNTVRGKTFAGESRETNFAERYV